MNSWNGSGGAGPGAAGSAGDTRIALAGELEDALAKVRALARSASVAPTHEQRSSELRVLMADARQALLLSTALDGGTDSHSGVVETPALRASAPPVSRVTPTEWLLRSVVHDLNNMLLVIQNCAESMRHQPNATVEREASVVEDAVTQAARLVAKLVPGESGIGRSMCVTLSDSVARFSGIVASLVGDPIRVVTKLAQDLPPVRCDETAVFRILSNLATNARDAMPLGGTLTLETQLAGMLEGSGVREGTPQSYVLLSVADTGHGMDAATRGMAFEPFFTTKEPGKGTGVGLTAVREIVQSMGGLMRIESALGRGTTVSVYLECIEPPAS